MENLETEIKRKMAEVRKMEGRLVQHKLPRKHSVEEFTTNIIAGADTGRELHTAVDGHRMENLQQITTTREAFQTASQLSKLDEQLSDLSRLTSLPALR